MTHDALKKLMTGLSRGEFTLTQVANEANIPLTTLADMRKPHYGSKLRDQLDRLDTLSAAIDRLRSKADDPTLTKAGG